MKNDQKYFGIFAKNLTNQRMNSYHKKAVREVIKAVCEDEAKKVSHPQLMDEIQFRDEHISTLQRRLSRIENEKHSQCWVSMGETLGKVSGPHAAIKEVRQLINDGENQRRTIRRLEIKIERYVKQLFGKSPDNDDSVLLPPPPPAPAKRVLSEDSRTLTTVVNTVKRFFLFGGK